MYSFFSPVSFFQLSLLFTRKKTFSHKMISFELVSSLIFVDKKYRTSSWKTWLLTCDHSLNVCLKLVWYTSRSLNMIWVDIAQRTKHIQSALEVEALAICWGSIICIEHNIDPIYVDLTFFWPFMLWMMQSLMTKIFKYCIVLSTLCSIWNDHEHTKNLFNL